MNKAFQKSRVTLLMEGMCRFVFIASILKAGFNCCLHQSKYSIFHNEGVKQVFRKCQNVLKNKTLKYQIQVDSVYIDHP